MIAKGQNKIIRFKQEQEWAVIPSNEDVSELRRVNASFDVVKNLLQSNEINNSYQIKNFVTGTKNAKGTILGELTPGAYSHLISHALASSYSWDTDELLITLKIEESPTSGLYRITRQSGSWLTSNIRSGLVIRLDGTVLDSGTKNNNLFVCSCSDLVLDVYVLNESSLILQDFIDGNRCYIAGAVTYAQKTNQIDKSFSFEECYTDIGHYELYSGNKIQSMQIDLQSSNEYPSISFDLIGYDLVRKDTASYFTSSSRNTNSAVSNKNSAIFIDGQPIGLVTAFNIVANRDLGLNNAVGLSTAIAITENMLKVNGSFTVYFTDASLKQRYYDEVACAMSVVLAESNYKGSPFVCITLPKAIIKSRSKNDNASSLFDTYEFTAVLGTSDSYINTVLSIQDSAAVVDDPIVPPVTVDPYFDNVSLLLHLDDDFSDSSGNPKTPTLVNSPQISSLSKFGAGAMEGGSSEYASYSMSTDFDFGMGDFTIEVQVQIDNWLPALQGLVSVGSYSDGVLVRVFNSAVDIWINGQRYIWPAGFSIGAYGHIAITRQSNTLRAWFNGTKLGTDQISGHFIAPSSGVVQIGVSSHNTSEHLNGFLDEVRITKGVARYTMDFTPPTEAFPSSGP